MPTAPPVLPIGAAGQSAIHTLTRTSTGGTFTIVTTNGTLICNAVSAAAAQTAAIIQDAIRATLGMSPAAATLLTVTGPAGGPWVITVPPNLVLALDADVAWTTAGGSGGTVVDAVTQYGLPAADSYAGSDLPTHEAPHIVGAAGQAAFAANWSTVLNTSVTPFAPPGPALATYQPLQYWQDAHGLVHVEGLAVWATGGTAAIFTLPAGYRPPYTLIKPSLTIVAANENSTFVKPDGTVNYAAVATATNGGAVDVGSFVFRPVYV